jgi:hypothetical protein
VANTSLFVTIIALIVALIAVMVVVMPVTMAITIPVVVLVAVWMVAITVSVTHVQTRHFELEGVSQPREHDHRQHNKSDPNQKIF